jgi:hypothetical protein
MFSSTKRLYLLALNRWDEGITTLEDAFQRLKDGETDTEDARN